MCLSVVGGRAPSLPLHPEGRHRGHWQPGAGAGAESGSATIPGAGQCEGGVGYGGEGVQRNVARKSSGW